MQRYTVYLYLKTGLHVSGGTTTHHQERLQLYLQNLVFVTPLLLPADPSSGALAAVSTGSGICHTVTATCRPIIRSAYSCIYRIWYLSHRYCYLPTYHQERLQLYLQDLVFVTPLLLPADPSSGAHTAVSTALSERYCYLPL